MDIRQTIPLLLANTVRFLSYLPIRGKIWVLIVFLTFGVTGALLVFEIFWAPSADAEFVAEISAAKQEIPNLVIFDKNSVAAVSRPYIANTNSSNKMRVVVTAYSSTPWETDGNPYITASGAPVEYGVIANNLLAFGTKVKIPELFGDEVFVVKDRMNWKKGNYYVDVWMPSYKEALKFGVKRTYIEVLRE